jgi:hypothetical protein
VAPPDLDDDSDAPCSLHDQPTRVAPDEIIEPLREVTRSDAPGVDALLSGMSVEAIALAPPLGEPQRTWRGTDEAEDEDATLVRVVSPLLLEAEAQDDRTLTPRARAIVDALLDDSDTVPKLSVQSQASIPTQGFPAVRGVSRFGDERLIAWTRRAAPIAGAVLLSSAVALHLVLRNSDRAAPSGAAAATVQSALPPSAPKQAALAPKVSSLRIAEPPYVTPANAPTPAAQGEVARATAQAPEQADDDAAFWDEAAPISSADAELLAQRKAERAIARGHAQLEAGAYQRARWSFERALTYRADDPEALAGLGAALLGQDRARDAAAAFQKALVVAPSDPRLHVGLGRAYAEEGNVKEAARAYERALALHPGDPEASAQLSALHTQ